MSTALGILGIVGWVAVTIAIAAAVTWAVVKVSPGEKPPPAGAQPPEA